MSELKALINIQSLPEHIAIIMDGNGRWAKARSMARLFGHKNGVRSVREVTETCAELGVKNLTLYTFSTENWNRPEDEVTGLMSLLIQTLKGEIESISKNNIRLLTIGDLDLLPESTRLALRDAEKKTENNTRMNLILALNYSGRSEIIHAVNKIAEDVRLGIIPNTIDDELFENYLYTKNIPDPELLIRTSGEHRISNFLLWQTAYTEYYFTDVLWPEFRAEDLYRAILDFQSRERRFGKTTEQLQKS